MKKIFGLIILFGLTITLASCGPTIHDKVYTEDVEYCCGETCCVGFEPFEEYCIGNNTLEVKETVVGGHIHKIVTTGFHV